MTKSVLMEIFRAGKQTDSSGNTKEWTESDLDTIIAKTKEIGEEIPFTIGHPKTDGPAWAWGSNLVRKGASLYAEMGSISDELALMLKKKLFKNRSIALRADMSMRHVALLGAEPPAVKGLEAFAFSEKDVAHDLQGPEFTENEFSSYIERDAFGAIARAFRSLRDHFIEKNGLDTADKMIPDYYIENIKRAETYIEPENTKLNFKETPEDQQVLELENAKKEIETLKGSFAEVNSKFEAMKIELDSQKSGKAEIEREFSEFKKNLKTNEFGEWADKQIAEGKVIPANRASTIAMLSILDGNEAQEFSEGSEMKKLAPVEIYKHSIESLEPFINFGEMYTKGNAGNRSGSDELGNKARELQKESGVSFNEALRTISKKHPELVQSI